jgi:hypothetical protein
MAAIDDLKNAVEAETSVVQSVVTLLNGLAQQLKDALATNNTAAVEDAANQIISNTAALSAAVTANTPTPPADTTAGAQGGTGTGTDTTAGAGATGATGP